MLRQKDFKIGMMVRFNFEPYKSAIYAFTGAVIGRVKGKSTCTMMCKGCRGKRQWKVLITSESELYSAFTIHTLCVAYNPHVEELK